MKLLLLCTLLGTVVHCKPGGYFRQEYQFKKSSSTYQNNQLQTKDDDQGFYHKQGDLEGPAKVDQHNEQSQYVSPDLGGLGQTVTAYDNRDLTDEAERAFNNHGLGVQDLKNNGGGARSYSSYSSYSTYGSSSTGRANLQQLKQSLQTDLEECLREAMSKYRSEGSYRSQSYMESQLKSNITRLMQDALYRANPTSAASYTVRGTGVYNNQNILSQELTDLRKELENSFINSLHREIQSSSGYRNTGRTISTGYDSAEIDDLNRQGYRQHPKNPYSDTQYSHSSGNNRYIQQQEFAQSQSQSQSSYLNNQATERNSYASALMNTNSARSRPTHNTQYQPIHVQINPHVRLTDVMQSVQNAIHQQIIEALRTHQQKYNDATSYRLTNSRPTYEASLHDLKEQVKYNLTDLIQKELERNYGVQTKLQGYSFSLNAGNTANYKLEDFDDLKKTVENNLNTFLENTLRSQENTYQQQVNTINARNRDYTSHGPQFTKGLTESASYTSHNPHYATSSHNGYASSNIQTHSTTQNAELEEITRRLQSELSKQLQKAVDEQRRIQTHSLNSQQLYQELENDLKQNITEELQRSLQKNYGNQGRKGGYSYTVTSGVYQPSANYRTQDLDAMMKQMQADLERQLREQVNSGSFKVVTSGPYVLHNTNSAYSTQPMKKYQQFNSYSHSSSGSLTGEKCEHGIDQQHRYKRDAYMQQRGSDYHSSQHHYYNNMYNHHHMNNQRFDHLGQQPEETYYTQYQPFDNYNSQGRHQHGNFYHNQNEQVDNLRQQQDDLHTLTQQSEDLGQQLVDLDNLSQQTDNFGQQLVDLDNLGQQTDDFGQQLVDLDNLSQQTEDFGQQLVNPGQKIEDLGQKLEDIDFDNMGQVAQSDDDYFELAPQKPWQTDDSTHTNIPRLTKLENAYSTTPSYESQTLRKPQNVPENPSSLTTPTVMKHIMYQQNSPVEQTPQNSENTPAVYRSYGYSPKLVQAQNKFPEEELEQYGQQAEDLGGLDQITSDLEQLGQELENLEQLGQQLEELDILPKQSEDVYGKFETGQVQEDDWGFLGQQNLDSSAGQNGFGKLNVQSNKHDESHTLGQREDDYFENIEQLQKPVHGYHTLQQTQTSFKPQTNLGNIEISRDNIRKPVYPVNSNMGQNYDDVINIEDLIPTATKRTTYKPYRGIGLPRPSTTPKSTIHTAQANYDDFQNIEDVFGNQKIENPKKPRFDLNPPTLKTLEPELEPNPINLDLQSTTPKPKYSYENNNNNIRYTPMIYRNFNREQVYNSKPSTENGVNLQPMRNDNAEGRTFNIDYNPPSPISVKPPVYIAHNNLDLPKPKYGQSLFQPDEDTQQIARDFYGNVKPVNDFRDHGDYLEYIGDRKDITHMETTGQISQNYNPNNYQTTEPNNLELSQQSEHFGQELEDMTQQSENFGQQLEDLTQQSENFGQQLEDLTQQSENFGQQSETFDDKLGNLGRSDENHDLGFKMDYEDPTKQSDGLTQQFQDLSKELVQEVEDLSQISKTYSAPVNNPSVTHYSSYGRSLDTERKPNPLAENINEITDTPEQVTEPPEPKSFWKSIGGKISNSFSTVKQKAKDIMG